MKDAGTYFDIGSRVLVGDRAKMPGVLRYLGTVHFVDGLWCGVELDEEEGLHDGTVQGIRYFACPPKKGVLAPLRRVTPATCSSLERNKNHGVLFNCPYEDVPVAAAMISKLPRPAFVAGGIHHCQHNNNSINNNNDDDDYGFERGCYPPPSRGGGDRARSFDVECLLDVKRQEARMRKSASPKRVTFDVEPEFFMEDDWIDCGWKKSRSESDSLLLFEEEINSNLDGSRDSNRQGEEDAVNFNRQTKGSGRESTDSNRPLLSGANGKAARPKSVSASLDAVESDLNDLLSKIDKEISNVKTPDTAEMGVFAPHFFDQRAHKQKKSDDRLIDHRHGDDDDDDSDDEVDGKRAGEISTERSGRPRGRGNQAEETDSDDIMLLTGSPTFRLAQTAMVQYAELLKASQAGFVAQKVRLQQPADVQKNKPGRVDSTSDAGSGCGREKTGVEFLDSPARLKRIHLDSSNSTSSSNDDVYETFDGEDLYPSNGNFDEDDKPPDKSQAIGGGPTAGDPEDEKMPEDVCNFLDSLLKSGQELEKWLEISVADLKESADEVRRRISPPEMCSDAEIKDSQSVIESYISDETKAACIKLAAEAEADQSIPGAGRILEASVEDVSKTRPLSYASTVDSYDTGCQMELDDDMARSLNVSESLIDLGMESDSLLLESWNELIKPDASDTRLRLDSAEGSGPEKPTADERKGDTLLKDVNLIDFESETRDAFPRSNRPEANGSDARDEFQIAGDALHSSTPRKPEFHECSERSTTENSKNASCDNLNFSSEVMSDSQQEANASGLSSTPGSSFSSCGQDLLLPRDASLNGFAAQDAEETLDRSDGQTSSVTLLGVLDLESWKDAETKESACEIPGSGWDASEKEDAVAVGERRPEIERPNSPDSTTVVEGKTPRVAKPRPADGSKEVTARNLKSSNARAPKSRPANPTKTTKIGTAKGSAKPSPDVTKSDKESRENVQNDAKRRNNGGAVPSKLSSSLNAGGSVRKAEPKTPLSNSVGPVSGGSPAHGHKAGQPEKANPARSKVAKTINNSVTNSSEVPGRMKSIDKEPTKTSARSADASAKTPPTRVHLALNSAQKKKEIVKDQKHAVPTTNSADQKQTKVDQKARIVAPKAHGLASRQSPKVTSTGVRQSPEIKKMAASDKTASSGSDKRQPSAPKETSDTKAMKNARNTMASGTGRKIPSNESLAGELSDLKNQLNEAKNLADQYHKEKDDFETLIANQERQYKERITRFERALEEKLAWLKSDLEVKHDNFVLELTEKHHVEMVRMKEVNEEKTTEMRRAYDRSKTMYEKQVEELRLDRDITIRDLCEKHQREVEAITQKYETSTKTLEDKMATIQRDLERSLASEKSSQDAAKHDRDLRQQALLEIDSLEVVIETKNSELKKIRLHNSALEEKLEEIPLMADRIVAMQRKIEQLEMILASKTEHEKELLDARQKLLKRSIEGDEAVRKLSMNNEELAWRLSMSELGSPIQGQRQGGGGGVFSPSPMSPLSPMSRSAMSFSTPVRK